MTSRDMYTVSVDLVPLMRAASKLVMVDDWCACVAREQEVARGEKV